MLATNAALGLSAGSLVISVLSLWRSGRARVLTMRTQVRRDATDLKTRVTALLKAIDRGVRSRQRVNAALGGGGSTQIFMHEAEADRAEVSPLRQALDGLEPIPALIGYAAMEQKVVAVQAVRTRCDQLVRKYEDAFEEDERSRQHLRDAAMARANRPPPPR